MTKLTLTAVDTTQIQQYVFGSNRLRENSGASELVEAATQRWVFDLLPSPNNVDVRTSHLDPDRTIHDSIAAEVIYVGGGNAVILFQGEPSETSAAVQFARKLTLHALKHAPGLEIVVAHRVVDWENDSLAAAVQGLLGVTLARKKQQRLPSLPLLGLGVTAACDSTGLVATGRDDENQRLVSREISAKLRSSVRTAAENRLHNLFPVIRQGGWEFSREFEDLGRVKHEDSYIAVVHADGNSMGRRIAAIAEQYRLPHQNREYINAIRIFSEAVSNAAQTALQRTADLLARALISDAELSAHYPTFPFRPLVFGGDDVTFVCHGSYGLALAAKYLQEFEQASSEMASLQGQRLTACAGVCVVKVRYPFARAYAFAEALCRNAKRFVKELQEQGEPDCSALDWHFVMGGITGTLEQVREQEYSVRLPGLDRTATPGTLCMRPIVCTTAANTWRRWDLFLGMVNAFAGDSGWSDKRNKVKALREALRRGPDAVRKFSALNSMSPLPLHDQIPAADIGKSGWYLDRCVYFDPIEAVEFCTDLAAIVSQTNQEAEHVQL